MEPAGLLDKIDVQPFPVAAIEKPTPNHPESQCDRKPHASCTEASDPLSSRANRFNRLGMRDATMEQLPPAAFPVDEHLLVAKTAANSADRQARGNSGSRLENLPFFSHSGGTPFLTL